MITLSFKPAILRISSLRIWSAKVTPRNLRRDRISIAFTLLSCFFWHTQASLPYNNVGTSTALCTASRAFVNNNGNMFAFTISRKHIYLTSKYIYLSNLIPFLWKCSQDDIKRSSGLLSRHGCLIWSLDLCFWVAIVYYTYIEVWSVKYLPTILR